MLHISKVGGKRRLDKVEELLNVGDTVKVLVDDIDPSGKLSLSMVADSGADSGAGSGKDSGDANDEPSDGQTTTESPEAVNTADSQEASSDDDNTSANAREYVSFEEHFSGTAEEVYGDMGPEPKDDGRGRRRRRSRR